MATAREQPEIKTAPANRQPDELWPTKPLAERTATSGDERMLHFWMLCIVLMLLAGLLKGLAGIL